MNIVVMRILVLINVFFAGLASAKNYALLIGNANYSVAPLTNPVNDATDFAHVLKDIGFDVRVLTDQDQEGMIQAIRDLSEQSRDNDGIGLFYFAGHGVQIDGENYLLPVAVPLRNEEEVKKNAIMANLVLRYMEDAKNRVNIVILDACRNNPFLKTRSLKARGLAPMDAPSGSLIAFATAPGTEALDGEGRNGLYTKHLMTYVKVPGLTVEQVFKRTREAVEIESERISGKRQSPREESSLKGGELYFVPPPNSQEGVNPEAVELAYWSSIANSENPSDFESYLTQYPEGKFADLAKNRLEALQSTQTARASTDARAAENTSGPPTQVALSTPPPSYLPSLGKRRRGGVVVSSPRNFSFSEDKEAPIKAAEFLSISCRDQIRNKRVLLQLTDNTGRGQVLRRSIVAKLERIGLRQTTDRAKADFVVRGKVYASHGVNWMVGLNEVDLTADFTLLLKNGNATAATSVYDSGFAGSNRHQAFSALWDEKGEEVVGRLFGDYCEH